MFDDYSTGDNLLDTNDLAKLLSLPPGTIISWRSKGDPNIPYLKYRFAVRYKPIDIIKFIETNTIYPWR